MESAVSNLVAPASRRSSPRAASSASAGPSCATPTAPTRCTSSSSGATKVDPARLDQALGELDRPARAVYVTQSETSTGVVNDIRALNEVARGPRLGALRGRGLGPRRRRAAPGRMGRGRSGRRLAEVADVPAGPGIRFGLRPGDGARRGEPRRPLLPRLAAHREGPEGGAAQLGVHAGRDPVPGARRRARPDLRGGARARFTPATPCSPARRGPGSRRSAWSGSAPTTTGANVVTVARLPDDIDGAKVPKLMRDGYGVTIAGRPGAPEGADRPHRPLRLLRRLRHRHRAHSARDGAPRPRSRRGARRRAGGGATGLRRGRPRTGTRC